MKRLLAVTVIGLLLLAPVFAMAANFTGSIQGFMCVTQGKVCPVGKEDPVAAVENVFVLLVDAAKGEYYFLPNLERELLVRHLNQEVKITGTLDKKFKSIKVSEISVKGKVVWSQAMEDQMRKDLFAD
ncbi:MAG: hypothetical protein HY742_11050 [Deltaproteobacteria bacterium]|nr:hypothetical protein [Deltaproteobacteria bacterium]